jgi:hypothetical protein
MRAFIEFPEAGDGRIEITQDFMVETVAYRSARLLAESEITPLETTRAYWDERMVNEDSNEVIEEGHDQA